MYEGTDGDRGKGKRVADLDVGVGTRYYLVAYLKTLGSEDVGLFAVCVLNQRDERGRPAFLLRGASKLFSGATFESPE